MDMINTYIWMYNYIFSCLFIFVITFIIYKNKLKTLIARYKIRTYNLNIFRVPLNQLSLSSFSYIINQYRDIKTKFKDLIFTKTIHDYVVNKL